MEVHFLNTIIEDFVTWFADEIRPFALADFQCNPGQRHNNNQSVVKLLLIIDIRVIEVYIFKYGPIQDYFLFIFALFTLRFKYKLKRHRWWARISNPGLQDGRLRQIHWAMVSASDEVLEVINFSISPQKNDFPWSGKPVGQQWQHAERDDGDGICGHHVCNDPR